MRLLQSQAIARMCFRSKLITPARAGAFVDNSAKKTQISVVVIHGNLVD